MDAGRKRELEAKVYAGERLTREDGVALFESDDLAWLGKLAHHKRTELNGEQVMFTVNRHVNLTDVCSASCAYCSFHRETGEKDASTMRLDEAVRKAEELTGDQPTEPHIAVTEIQRLEQISGRSASEILDELIGAGLESLTGAADDTTWEDWSRIHRLAHEKGLKTAATMLYGDTEEPREQIDHVIRLRELQDETGGFAVLIPLRTAQAAPAQSLKTFAVARLMFDNVPHVKSLWAMHGVSVAQLTLNFGADDLDGEIAEGEIDRDDLLELIWDAGFQPVERDRHYEVVRDYDSAPSLASRRAEPATVWA